MNTLTIQQALRAKGFPVGPIDGVRGRMTIAAIKAFQTGHDLRADGIVGPLTAGELFGSGGAPPDAPPVPATLPWYAEAMRLIGVTEGVADSDNPLIVGWGRALRIAYGRDEIPWCGLFVAHCIGSQLPDEPLPNNPLGARNWIRFGRRAAPQPGAVLVFWRKSPQSGLGHVGFYVGEDKTAYHVLGGNQSNAVTVTRVRRDRLVDARWPATVARPAGGPVKLTTSGALSSNEQ